MVLNVGHTAWLVYETTDEVIIKIGRAINFHVTGFSRTGQVGLIDLSLYAAVGRHAEPLVIEC